MYEDSNVRLKTSGNPCIQAAAETAERHTASQHTPHNHTAVAGEGFNFVLSGMALAKITAIQMKMLVVLV